MYVCIYADFYILYSIQFFKALQDTRITKDANRHNQRVAAFQGRLQICGPFTLTPLQYYETQMFLCFYSVKMH